jgi:hypothetical protein
LGALLYAGIGLSLASRTNSRNGEKLLSKQTMTEFGASEASNINTTNPPAVAAAAQSYTVTPLPPPSGYVFFNLDGSMNNAGQVLGEAGSPGGAVRFPVLWTNGVPQILPMPSGSVYQATLQTYKINDAGTVIGTVYDASNTSVGHIAIWKNGIPSILDIDIPIPGSCVGTGCTCSTRSPSVSYGINAAGHILGSTDCPAYTPGGVVWVYNGATIRILTAPIPPQCAGLPAGYYPGVGWQGNFGINDADRVLGGLTNFFCSPPNISPGVPWSVDPVLFEPDGTASFLPMDGLTGVIPNSINNPGNILGFYTSPTHLVVWDSAGIHDLGLSGYGHMNNLGQVVYLDGSSKIEIWQGGVSTPIQIPAELLPFYPHNPPIPDGFNDVGQIAVQVAGVGGYLLTPTPTLGNYSDTSVSLSTNTTITPDFAPANTTSINVSTSSNFKGKLEGDPTTGVVHVTDAHPAGTYTVTVKGFNGSNGPTTTKTLALTVTTPSTCNPLSFASDTFEVGNGVGGTLVGDFNGDGKQDLAVVAVTASFSVRTLILLGDGTGHFNFFSEVPIGARAVADFNGDGKQDLIALDSSNAVMYLGDGMAHFSAGNSVDTGCAAAFQLAVGDFNGDGKLDLAFACSFTDTVTMLLGDGTGGFGSPASFDVSDGPQGLAVGDFNGDGKQDLAVACITAGNVSILLGNGVGSFAGAVNFNAGPTPRDVEVGDFNGDGKQDLAFSNPSVNAASVLMGDGTGGFGAPTSFAVGSDPETIIAVGDFNGDGKQDLAVPNFGSANVSILLGDGGGGFGSAINLSVGLSPFGVVVGDFNGDGKQDLATANWGSNNVSILLRDCGNTPAGTNILVHPLDSTTGIPAPVTVNFSQVTIGGMTSVTSDSNYSGQPLPSKFKLGDPPTYYDITTTAQYTPPVTVCVGYSNTAYQHDESNLRLMHFNGIAWENITTFIDVQANIVCGVTNSLSPFVVAEEDVHAPEFTVPANINANATSSGGTLVTYVTPVASDDFDGTVPVNCSPQSGSTFALGTSVVICTATDSAGNTKQKNFNVTVTYGWSGLLQPINADGSSIFKLGSTVPVKFALTDASAGVTNAVARLFYSKTNNNVVGTDLEATTTVSASTGNLFRYDTTTRQYIYNWSTKGLTTGTYQLKIDLVDGTTHTVSVSLK